MDLILVLQIALLALLLGLSGFFSSSETALFSLDKLQLERMRQAKHPKLSNIQRLLAEPRRLIVTILIGNELVNVAASNISATVVMHHMGGTDAWWVNIFIMLPLLLLIGEITPKTLAVRNNERFSSAVSGPIELFARLITPLRWIVRIISDLLITLVSGDKSRSQGNIVTEDLVRTLADEAAEAGALDEAEKEYIHNIIAFGNRTVEEVMTPRSNMETLTLQATMVEVMQLLELERVSRVPVVGENPDEVVGILYYRDLLSVDLSGYSSMEDLKPLLRQPYFVPESKPILDLMHSFREKKRSLALILDEYGGVTGLVTMGDLLASIFGEIHDPEDPDNDATAESLENGCYRLDGNLDVAQANQLIKATLDVDVAETIGGLLLHTHGELPQEGTVIALDQWCFKITRMEGTRIIEAIACHVGRETGKVGCEALLRQGERKKLAAKPDAAEGEPQPLQQKGAGRAETAVKEELS
uniref:HlyC/CorC family transporter n=1 Tax=Magnetococcus massalia (strain MO-1) TaxID=451514 RepID=A0A1S7LEL4_MAGMO|nr:conserved exported protein of unknown function[Include 2 CBS domain and Transporter associated domain] [Candidatus Magnetococcus massalia]